MTKKEMRKKMLSLRDSLSEKECREKSRVIAKRLFTLEEFQKAEVVLSYQSFRSEVETTEMNQKIRESGKSLYLPKTYADRKEMAFYRVYSDADLIPGYQGILEPQEKEPFTEELVSLKPEKVLMLMPGAAFDDKGNRIGYGGGYYDRYLESHPQLHTLALAFDMQVLFEVPAEEQDIKPQLLVTETNIYQEG